MKKKDPFATPLWVKLLSAAAVSGSLTIVGLIIWGVVKLVPPVAHWLERH